MMNLQKKHSLFFCKRFGYFLAILILVSSFIIGIWYVLGTDFFKVAHFEIFGNQLGMPEQLKTATAATLLQNFKLKFILQPDNILFWYLNKGNVSIEATDPFVAQVNVAANLFSKKKQVNLTMEERNLAGIWCNDSDCFIFDRNGFIFYPFSEAEGVLIMKIRDFSGRTLLPGQKILPNDVWIKNLFKTAKMIEESGFPIVELKINNLELKEWGAVLPNNLIVYFSLEFIPDNFQNVFKNLAQKIDLDKLTYLDFRVPNRIYYR